MKKEEDGFLKYNNIIIEEVNEQRCLVKLLISKNSLNPYGMVHGGLIFSLGDTVTGIHCKILRKRAVTLNASINFLKPGTGKYLIADSKIIKSGNKICVLESNIYDDHNNLIANMSTTYFFID